MTKIEIDTKDLEEREGILMTETCCQRFYRLISQFIRAIFVFSFLVFYPVIIIYDIIPRYDGLNSNKDYVSIISISSYLFVILGLQLFGTVRAIRSFHERKKISNDENGYKSKYLFQQKKFKWNLGSMIAIILMFYEVFQLIMFTYQAIEEETDDKMSADSLGINVDALNGFANFIINICYVSINFVEDNILDYYMIFSLFCVGLLLLIFVFRFLYELRYYAKIRYIIDDNKNYKTIAHQFYFHSFIGTIIYGHGKLKNVNKFTSKIVSILSDALFIVICQKLILMLSCNNDSYSRIDPNQQCWIGKHKLYSTVSLILLGYYIPICIMISPMFAETAASKEEKEKFEEKKKSNKGLCCCCCCKKNDEDDEKYEVPKDDNDDDDKQKDKSSFWSFENTIEFVSPYLSALTLSECLMLISSEFVSKGKLFGLIISQIIIMIFLLIFTFKWSLNNLYLYGLTNNEPSFPFSSSMIRSFGYLSGFGACCIQIFYYRNIIHYTISLLFTFIFVIFIAIIMIMLYYKYYNVYLPYQQIDAQYNKNQNLMLNYNQTTNVMKLIVFKMD